MLEQVGNGQKRTIDASQRNNVRDIKEPEPWLGKPQDWRKQKRELIAYMAKRRNHNNVPFLYLIREEQGYIETDDNDMSVIIRDTPHHGSVYQADNYEFFQVLISWTSGGTMEALVDRYRSTQDGRSAWQMIITMMDGQDSRNARIKDADARIDNAFYREDRSQFTFEQYCAVHITSNIEMEELNVQRDGFTQVRKFLDGIKHQSMQGLKFLIMDNEKTKADLQAAVIKMKDLWNQSKPAAASSSNTRNRDERNIGNANFRAFRGGGRGRDNNRGRGGYYRGGRYHNNSPRGGRGGRNNTAASPGRGRGRDQGTDYIPQEVLDSLTPLQRRYMLQGRNALRQADIANPGMATTTRTVGAITTDTTADNSSMVSGISQNTLPSGVPHPNMPGTPSGAAQRFGHRNTMGAIMSSNRHIGKINKILESDDYIGRYKAEIDTRADTVCAGQGFALIHHTGRIADVSGFHSNLGAITGVPIAQVATAYDTAEHETFILVFNEALYFGQTMETSLIPPQQVCDNGLVCDPLPRQYSRNSIHGIEDPSSGLIIPFQLHGCISYFPVRLPTEDELKHCRWIEMTSQQEWNPYDTRFIEQERPHLSHPHRINMVSVTSSQVGNPPTDIPYDFLQNRFVANTSSMDRQSQIDHATLARRWGISESWLRTLWIQLHKEACAMLTTSLLAASAQDRHISVIPISVLAYSLTPCLMKPPVSVVTRVHSCLSQMVVTHVPTLSQIKVKLLTNLTSIVPLLAFLST